MADPDVQVSRTTLDQLIASALSDGIQKKVAGAVIILQGNVLVLQRRIGDFMGGLVELPSGNVERDETLIQALVREVAEETGLQIASVDRYIGSFDYRSGSGKSVRQFNFKVTVQPGQVVLDPQEHSDYHQLLPTIDSLNCCNMSEETKQTILNAIC